MGKAVVMVQVVLREVHVREGHVVSEKRLVERSKAKIVCVGR